MKSFGDTVNHGTGTINCEDVSFIKVTWDAGGISNVVVSSLDLQRVFSDDLS